jgi:hypothetical protein
VLAHLVSLAISWALLTRIGSIEGFRGISKGKHNTAHLERELELENFLGQCDRAGKYIVTNNLLRFVKRRELLGQISNSVTKLQNFFLLTPARAT